MKPVVVTAARDGKGCLIITAANISGEEIGTFKEDPGEAASVVRKQLATQLARAPPPPGEVPIGFVTIRSNVNTTPPLFVYSTAKTGKYEGCEHRYVNFTPDPETAAFLLTHVKDDLYTITDQHFSEYLIATPFHDDQYGATNRNPDFHGKRRWIHTNFGKPDVEDNDAALWEIKQCPDKPGVFMIMSQKYREYMYMTQHTGVNGRECHTYPFKSATPAYAAFQITPADAVRLILPDGGLLKDVPKSMTIAEAFDLDGKDKEPDSVSLMASGKVDSDGTAATESVGGAALLGSGGGYS